MSTLPDKIDARISTLNTVEEVNRFFKLLFEADARAQNDESATDYGLKKSGQKYRENINQQCLAILERLKTQGADTLTNEEVAILKQYSGKGGLSENSLFEYYTPTPIAEGVWDIMRQHGFENGNVLDPCTGAGVFSATKPTGTVVTGCDLDPTSSQIAQLLNPGDTIMNQSFEELAANTPDESFDCAIGNVPFGDARGASKHKDKKYSNERYCQRYFILRALDKVRPGGLCCFICPPDIVQKKGWDKFRMAISAKAEFLGAHKLPTGTFAAQGTQTVTDIIVLKKHPRDILERIKNKELDAATLKEAKLYWDTFITGKYWQKDGKPFIHGTFVPKDPKKFMDRDKVLNKIDNMALKKKLAVRFKSRIDWELLNSVEGTSRTYSEGDRLEINGDMHVFRNGEWVKEVQEVSTTALDKAMFGVDSYEALQELCKDPQALLGLTLEQLKNIASAYRSLLAPDIHEAIKFASQQADECKEQSLRGAIVGAMIARMARDNEQGKDTSETRDRLQALVAAEFAKFGNPKKNKKLKYLDNSSKNFGLFMNSVKKDGSFSDLLAGTLDRSAGKAYDETDICSIVEYLSHDLGNDEYLDLEDVKRLYKGAAKISSIEDLAGIDGIAVDPDSGLVTSMSKYSCGDIYPKIAACRKAMAGASDLMQQKLQAQIDEIERRRTWTKADDIQFSLSNAWLNRELVFRFLESQGYTNIEWKIVETDDKGKPTTVYDAEYNDPEGQFYNDATWDKFGNSLTRYMNGLNPTGSKQADIDDAKDRIRALEETFDAWVKQQPEIEELEAEYNRKFNGYILPPSDSSPLGLENLSGEIDLHGYQNEEIRRLSNLGSGICGFGTGLGKSFTALGLAMYNTQKGRHKRTCIVVPSAVLENWYHEARQMYSEEFMKSKMFFVGIERKVDKNGNGLRKNILDENGQPRVGKDGQPLMQDVLKASDNKQKIFEQLWSIPQSNYSIVVMTKEKFATIPVSNETRKDYMDTMVARRLVEDESKKSKKKRTYQDDKNRLALEEEFSKEGRKKSEQLPTIEELGFDSIIMDEAHFFKNSLEGSKVYRNTQFVPNAPCSQIARDMSIKCHYIRKKNGGKGVFGLSATPVTNSPLEIFNMLSLVMDTEEFAERGIDTPDKFMRFFAKTEPRQITQVSGEVVQKDAVVGFKQLDALRSIFSKYCNIKTVQDVDQEIHVPNQVDNKEEVTISDEQATTYANLRSIAQAEMKKSKDEADIAIFSIMRDMERVSMDMDMFKHTMTFILDKKHKDAAKKIVDELEEIAESKLFDVKKEHNLSKKKTLGFYNTDFEAITYSESANEVKIVAVETLEDELVAAFKKYGITDERGEPDVRHPVPPKYAKLIANMEPYLQGDIKGKQIIFTDEKSQHNKLLRILEKNVQGLEPGRTAIINAEAASGTKLDAISKAFNSGEIWVVIANKKAEVGVNLQKGTKAIHHLTLPWTPASINQRNGRGVRQGNKVAGVDVYYYLGKGTFDEYRQSVLEGKANWINQLLTGNELTAENADAASTDEMAIMLSDNPEEQRRLIEEQKAKRAAEEALRKRKMRANLLAQYVHAKLDFANYDQTTETKLADMQDNLAEMERLLAQHKTTVANTANADNEYWRKVAEATQKKVDSLEKRVASMKERIEKYREDRTTGKPRVETTMKRNLQELQKLKAKGELEFDIDEIVDNEGDFYIAPASGLVFRNGSTVTFDDDKRRNIYVFSFKKSPTGTTYRVDNYTGDYSGSKYGYGAGSISEVELQKMRPVTVSDEDRIVATMLAMPSVFYSYMRDNPISKETFLRIRDQFGAYSGGQTYSIYEDNGHLDVGESYESSRRPLAYPEPNNPVWKERVFKVAAASKYNNPRLHKDLGMLFGMSPEEVAEKLGAMGTEATEADFVEAMQEVFARIKANVVKKEDAESYLYLAREINIGGSLLSDFVQGVYNTLAEKGMKHSNLNPFALFPEFVDARQKECAAKAEILAAESTGNDGGNADIEGGDDTAYSGNGIDAGTREALAAKGVTIFLNEGFSTHFRRKKYEFKAKEWYMLNDENGFRGILYKNKSKIKSAYNATFTKDYPPHKGTAFWMIPVKAISPYELQQLAK